MRGSGGEHKTMQKNSVENLRSLQKQLSPLFFFYTHKKKKAIIETHHRGICGIPELLVQTAI